MRHGDSLYEEIPETMKVQRIMAGAIGRSKLPPDDSIRMIMGSRTFRKRIESVDEIPPEEMGRIADEICEEVGFSGIGEVDECTKVKCALTEYYRRSHDMSGKDVVALFDDLGVFGYIDGCYKVIGGEDPNEFLMTVDAMVAKRDSL